jgi:two-component system cell cycle response regulator DivK
MASGRVLRRSFGLQKRRERTPDVSSGESWIVSISLMRTEAGKNLACDGVQYPCEEWMSETGKLVLLVEDNEDNRIVYSTILKHFGYSVIEALNGEEGIAKARAQQPDLVLMDISIPVIDGWEATQVLKHDPATRHIPIIALTAHALASDREKAMEVGCDGYLAKPCEPRAVVAEVQRFLGRPDAG